MTFLKIFIGVVSLVAATNSYANIGRMKSNLSSTTASVGLNSLNSNLMVPTFKMRDPNLGGGGALHNNFADCPFKSRAAKDSNSSGERYGKGKTEAVQAARDTGNR